MNGFFDTNVLIYATAGDPDRMQAARDRLLDGGVISTQVLNEFVSVSRGKLKRSWTDIESALALIRAMKLTILPVTLKVHERGFGLARDHNLHIYDAMIVAAALESMCSVLWTEALSDGQRFGALTIRNPF